MVQGLFAAFTRPVSLTQSYIFFGIQPFAFRLPACHGYTFLSQSYTFLKKKL